MHESYSTVGFSDPHPRAADLKSLSDFQHHYNAVRKELDAMRRVVADMKRGAIPAYLATSTFYRGLDISTLVNPIVQPTLELYVIRLEAEKARMERALDTIKHIDGFNIAGSTLGKISG